MWGSVSAAYLRYIRTTLLGGSDNDRKVNRSKIVNRGLQTGTLCVASYVSEIVKKKIKKGGGGEG